MEAQTQAVFIFDPESHRYTVNGAEIPSVTQVLKEAGLTKEYSSMEAAERGTVVHLACECADLGINVTDLIVDPYVTAWRRFRSETGFTHSDIENTELERRALTWPEKAKQTMIEDQVTYDRASAMLLGIKDLRRDIDLHYDPLIAKAYAAHKATVAAKKKIEAPLAEAETILKTGISRWHAEQERARQELERKAREESEHLAEEIRLEMAVQAEESGAPAEVVQEMLESSISLPAPVAAPTYQKADGISTRRRDPPDGAEIKGLL